MMKTYRLLNINDPQHCTALHLLLSKDGLKKLPAVSDLLLKARNIVTALHYKSYAISQEALFKQNLGIFQKITEAYNAIHLDEQFPIQLADASDDIQVVQNYGYISFTSS